MRFKPLLLFVLSLLLASSATATTAIRLNGIATIDNVYIYPNSGYFPQLNYRVGDRFFFSLRFYLNEPLDKAYSGSLVTDINYGWITRFDFLWDATIWLPWWYRGPVSPPPTLFPVYLSVYSDWHRTSLDFVDGKLADFNMWVDDSAAMFLGINGSRLRFGITDYEGSYGISSVWELRSVPEPKIWVQFIVGFAGVGYASRLKRAARSKQAASYALLSH